MADRESGSRAELLSEISRLTQLVSQVELIKFSEEETAAIQASYSSKNQALNGATREKEEEILYSCYGM